MNDRGRNSLDISTFNRLRRLYIFALGAIACSVIISQIIIRDFLSNQQEDSTIINVAGRQRMLSQKLSKEVLLIANATNFQERLVLKDTLKETINRWKISHLALQEGSDSLKLSGTNSEKNVTLFNRLQTPFSVIFEASQHIVTALENNPNIDFETLKPYEKQVTANEYQFLTIMDTIVNQYDSEANDKVNLLRHWELLLMIFTLLLLFLEFLFIFKPTARMVRQTISKLLRSESHAIKTAHEADVLREENEKSVKELRILNQAMDKTLLFARVTSEGEIIHIGDKFSKLFNQTKFNINLNFSELISTGKNDQQYIEHILKTYKKTGWQGEIKASKTEGEVIWLEMYLIPIHSQIEKSEILIIASDITEKKQTQLDLESLTKSSYEEKMNQQKIISSKIIENQEQEQNRIAKDIHDGIGQMLTGLKYNLESVNLNDLEKAASKIEHLKSLTGDIIQGVRAATFNLTPPELSDYGIVPALSKLTQELSRLTGKNIELYNRTNFNRRLDSLLEINMYRITQEAINNAIKYADSTYILVSISHSEHMLSITIDDDGKGFDVNRPKNIRTGIGGMGMTFMNERINYINGRLFLHSSEETGTRITLNIPI
ncbi:multi-sensor signal transduction histidine kinas e [Formosa agariphila KMM 3901]|uniref:histidine kinase n=1 Tax=Formosa agariphila (strain DSM 15362 / KCTC 12365 / LMG 23005 / KMM 3901 / M-2Alg 35-1) TaxID=1347342 RepID=T2KK38_FORAG|nr:ATP-binding protein [Formosa agariphila]CDF78359.1 multi-sensor signal transduction histidine kinas e [Formosa agariphila KMM 3901]